MHLHLLCGSDRGFLTVPSSKCSTGRPHGRERRVHERTRKAPSAAGEGPPSAPPASAAARPAAARRRTAPRATPAAPPAGLPPHPAEDGRYIVCMKHSCTVGRQTSVQIWINTLSWSILRCRGHTLQPDGACLLRFTLAHASTDPGPETSCATSAGLDPHCEPSTQHHGHRHERGRTCGSCFMGSREGGTASGARSVRASDGDCSSSAATIVARCSSAGACAGGDEMSPASHGSNPDHSAVRKPIHNTTIVVRQLET